MYTRDGKIQLVILQEDSEQILRIINHAVGHELREAGIHNITNVYTPEIINEYTTAVKAINHHHDVLYQRGINSGLKGVNQLGVDEINKFDIEGGTDLLKQIVVLVEIFAKISLFKETGLRGATAPSNVDVFGTSKKTEKGALIAALDAYWNALREKAWEMVRAMKASGGQEGGKGEGAAKQDVD